MACADVTTVRAKPVIAINLSIVLLLWAIMSTRGGYRPPLDVRCSLADVHQAIAEFDQGAGYACDAVACGVVIPPAVAVPRPTGIAGRQRVVWAGHDRGFGSIRGTTMVGRVGFPNRAAIVGTILVITCTPRGSAGDGSRADGGALIVPACDAATLTGVSGRPIRASAFSTDSKAPFCTDQSNENSVATSNVEAATVNFLIFRFMDCLHLRGTWQRCMSLRFGLARLDTD